MGVFEDAVLSAKSLAKAVSGKAEKFIDISKKKLNAAELNNRLEKFYAALGKLYFDAEKNGTDHEAENQQLMTEIESISNELNEINASIQEDMNKNICTKCGAANDEDAVYCSKCGNKLDIEA